MCKRTDDEQVIPSCGAILSHFRSGWRVHLVTYGGFSKSVQKCGWPPLTFSTSVILLTFDLSPSYIFFHHLTLIQQVYNTPSIWRWRMTRVHSETTAIRERMVPYVLWVQNISVFVFLLLGVSICSLFFTPGRSFCTGYNVHQSWVERSWGVWHFSYRAKANLTKTHMHANVNPHRS